MTATSANAPCKVQDAVTGGYPPSQGISTPDENLVKLRAIVILFNLALRDLARVGGVSRPYISRVLGGGLKPSNQFLRRLEAGLGLLIQERQGQFFKVATTPVEAAEQVLARKP